MPGGLTRIIPQPSILAPTRDIRHSRTCSNPMIWYRVSTWIGNRTIFPSSQSQAALATRWIPGPRPRGNWFWARMTIRDK